MTSASAAALPRRRLVGVGFGPSHLSMAALHATTLGAADTSADLHFLESRPSFDWHPAMLLPGARMQVAFLKDLVTPREPTSPFSFVNFLVAHGRLEQFLNLATLNPTRCEFVEYFRWAADQLASYVSYDSRVHTVRPVCGPDGRVSHLEVDYQGPDGTSGTVAADHLSLAPGGDPVIPAAVEDEALATGAVFHSSSFLTGVQAFRDAGREAPLRFLLVGAGQSAAEIFQYLAAEFPRATVTLIHRGFALMPANSSALANAIFDPASVDMFHAAPASRREGVLADLRTTNYAAVDEADIDAIAGLLYEQQVTGARRLQVRRFTELLACESQGRTVRAAVRDVKEGVTDVEEFDAVVLATGYDFRDARGLLAGIDRYLIRDAEGRLVIERDYSIRTVPEFTPRVFAHGAAEHTHGLASTLLSLLAHRAGDILDALRSHPARPTAVPPGPSSVLGGTEFSRPDHRPQGVHA